MKIRSALLTILFGFTLTLSGVQAAKLAGNSDESPLGPYTEIRLPLEDLAQPNQDLVFNQVVDQFPSGLTLQIMHVLKDPRGVPAARFAYHSPENGGVVSHTLLPSEKFDSWAQGATSYAEELEKIRQETPIALNVYVRVQAPEDKEVPDPIFAGYYQDEAIQGFLSHFHTSGGRPNLFIYRMSKVEGREQQYNSYLCAVPEYADGTQPYRLPDEIEGGKAVRGDGRYDPKAYAPPRPWYFGEQRMLEPGEVREGWVSCMAPDVPLEELQIRVRYTYIEPPEPTTTPGPSPTPWPTPSEEDEVITQENCEEREDCAIVEDLNDPVCAEVSVCILRPDPTFEALNATPDATEIVLQKTNEAERYLPRESIGEKIAWAYSSARPFPDGGIKLADVPLEFMNSRGETKTARGSAVFQTAHTFNLEGQRFLHGGKYMFVSRVAVEPEGLTGEELRGFTLSRVGAYIEMYDRPDAPFINASYSSGTSALPRHHDGVFYPTLSSSTSAYRIGPQDSRLDLVSANYWLDEFDLSDGPQPFSELFFHKPDSPLEGFVFAKLDNDDDRNLGYQDYLKKKKDLPPTVWFSIKPRLPVYQSYKALYPSRGVNIRNNSLEPTTDMCEYVECLDVSNPDDERQEVRTVPLFCPGEWSNNFTIDGLVIERMEYLGEPPGLTSLTKYLYRYSKFHEKEIRIWVYAGKIMSGLTPWWLPRGHRLAALEGKIVDKNTGQYIDSEPHILPYYYKGNKTYYLPAYQSQHIGGWISGVANKKLLIFGLIDDDRYSKENTVYLFQEEGPAWSTTCQRSSLPALTSPNSYASSQVQKPNNLKGNTHIMAQLMPGTEYPPSQPHISGEILAIDEEGSAIFGQVLKPTDVRIVPGKVNKSVVYAPEEDAFYPAKENVSWNNEVFFERVNAQLIPPDSSLVMVKIRKVPPGGPLPCDFSNRSFQLSYPGYFPITSQPGSIRTSAGPFSVSCPDDFTEKWIFFRFPSLDIELEDMLFSIRGEEKWVFWNLSEGQKEE